MAELLGVSTKSLYMWKAQFAKPAHVREAKVGLNVALKRVKVDSAVRYLGVELEDALSISEATKIRMLGWFVMDGPKQLSFYHSEATVQLPRIGNSSTMQHLAVALIDTA